MKKIKFEISANQADLLVTAINAEIKKGSGTFLSENSVRELGGVMNELRSKLIRGDSKVAK